MTKTFEKEVNKIVELHADDYSRSSLKQAIFNLFEKLESGDLKDEVIDVSHISEHQTDIFSQISTIK